MGVDVGERPFFLPFPTGTLGRYRARQTDEGAFEMAQRTLILGAAVGVGLAVAGSAQAQDKTYGVLMKTLSNPFWGAMEQGVEAAANELGVEYYLQAVESDQAAEPQLNVCNTMLERAPAVMITAAINSTNLLPCLKQANEMGIPVVDLDANIDYEVAKEAGVEIAFTIGSDNLAAGAQGADYLVEVVGADATGPVLVIEGLSGNITGQRRAQGFAERLAETAPGLEIVASLAGDWDRGKAANITNDILTRYPDLRAIFAANDVMALGAVETAYAAGKGEEIVIIGVDGNVDAVESIKAGRLDASVAQLPYLVGKQAVEKVTEVLNGGAVEQFIAVPTLVLTKDVLEKGEEPLLEYVK
jgi:D-allose transport system substrate-binding protein